MIASSHLSVSSPLCKRLGFFSSKLLFYVTQNKSPLQFDNVDHGTNFHVCQFVFIFFCPDPINVMIDTKDKNETAVEREQKNKNANKKVV
jgi:hypothetical protein